MGYGFCFLSFVHFCLYLLIGQGSHDGPPGADTVVLALKRETLALVRGAGLIGVGAVSDYQRTKGSEESKRGISVISVIIWAVLVSQSLLKIPGFVSHALDLKSQGKFGKEAFPLFARVLVIAIQGTFTALAACALIGSPSSAAAPVPAQPDTPRKPSLQVPAFCPVCALDNSL